MSILIFALILFSLVLVHEFGHFIVAKKTGMRVDEFGIGFPPRLFGIKKDETLYSINALPIGGFVRIFGEDASESGEGTDSYSRAFAHKPRWAQALVLIAGITANILFAWVLFSTALAIGTDTLVSPEEAGPTAELTVVGTIPDSPAARAGIPDGAVITGLSVDGEFTTPHFFEEFRSVVLSAGGSDVTVTYRFRGDEMSTTLEALSGVTSEDSTQPAIGVLLGLMEKQSLPLHQALYEGASMTVFGLRDITIGIGTLIRDAVFLNADLTQVAGPVGIVGLVGEASAFGITTLLMFTAFISLNLAIINLLPFPALDGGRLLFVLIETVTRKTIRPQIAYYVNATGFLLLIVLMVAITFNDIARLV